MKKWISKILYIILLSVLFIIPNKVDAASFKVSASKSMVAPGETVTFTFATDTAFSTSAINIKYDASKWDLVSHKTLQGTEVPNATAGSIVTSVSVTTGSINGNFYQVVLKSKSTAVSGISNVSISTSDCWAPDGLTPITMKVGSITLNHYVASSNNALKSLSITGCTINFSEGTTTYSCPETESASVTITATAADSKAQISGVGVRNFGNNTLNVVVTAENGAVRTYTINIRKKDNRSSNVYLSSLIIEGYNIDFKKDVYEYTIDVKDDVESVIIKAVAADSNSTVIGTGSHSLSVGQNRLQVRVTAENGDVNTYFINVNRPDKENKASAILTELSYNGINLDVSKRIFTIGIANEITTLDLKYSTSSKTSTYTVTGNSNLKPGINIIEIKVTDVGVKEEIYTLVVNKITYTPVTNLEENINLSNDTYYNTYNNIIYLPDNVINNLKNASGKMIVNNVNANDGLNFSLEIDKENKLPKNNDLYIVKSNNDPLTYLSNIPSGVEIKLFIDNENLNGKKLKLYGYDEDNRVYKLIIDGVTITDYYVAFTSEGYDKYIFTPTEILNEQVEDTSSLNGIFSFIAGGLITAGGYVMIKYILKKKNERGIRY